MITEINPRVDEAGSPAGAELIERQRGDMDLRVLRKGSARVNVGIGSGDEHRRQSKFFGDGLHSITGAGTVRAGIFKLCGRVCDRRCDWIGANFPFLALVITADKANAQNAPPSRRRDPQNRDVLRVAGLSGTAHQASL